MIAIYCWQRHKIKIGATIYRVETFSNIALPKKKIMNDNFSIMPKKIQCLLTLAGKFDIIKKVFMMAVLWNSGHSVKSCAGEVLWNTL